MIMNKQIAILIVGVVVLVFVAGYYVHIVAADNCQLPNPNTKACYSPSSGTGPGGPNGGGWVASCTATLTPQQCSDSTSYHVYEIKKFPDGAVNADYGYTTEDPASCWRAVACTLDTQTNKCKQSDVWSPWYLDWKTYIDTSRCCPEW